MRIEHIPFKQCSKCMRRQWIVNEGWIRDLKRTKNESDAKYKKRIKENDSRLDTAVCQFCEGGGQRHNLNPNNLSSVWS